MSVSTSIAWTDATWTPLRARRLDDGKVGWHCEKVSAGCASCYAETFNGRRLPNGGTGLPYARDKRGLSEHYIDESILAQPLKWRKPRRVFVCSMTDLFGEWVTDDQIDQVFAVMALARQHTFQVLTKRADRMRSWAESRSRRTKHVSDAGIRLIEENGWCVEERWEGCFPSRNVHLGVSVEDQATADARIPALLATPAAVRFVSYEPALGPVRLHEAWVGWGGVVSSGDGPAPFRSGDRVCVKHGREINWLIVGGESGLGARPCDVAWIRSIVGQCRDALVPCFVKQLGAHPVEYPTVAHQVRGGAADGQRFTSRKVYDPDDPPPRLFLSDRKGGDPLEWDSDLRVREFPR